MNKEGPRYSVSWYRCNSRDYPGPHERPQAYGTFEPIKLENPQAGDGPTA